MWTKSYSKTYKDISKDQVWRHWIDINNWHNWHDDLDYCKLDGQFKTGNYFTLKPKNMKEVRILIADIQEGSEFTDCTSFLGAKMYDTHSMEETEDGLLIKPVR